MNITLDLSKGQLSKLRNGHGIRISPTMLGSGVEMIIDPMTYHNMMKKLDKSKGVVIKMGSNEIQLNKMEGTGLFAGSGNQSGKISRVKKAGKWRDFSVDTAKQGIDVAKYGYEKYQEATNPVQSKLKKMFGFGDMDQDVEGGMLSMADIKKSYNKNVKNTKLGKALKETAEKGLGQVYDTGVVQIGKTKHLGSVADVLKKSKKGNISKLTQLSGLGLKLHGGEMKDARYRRPITMGNGMRMSGGSCSMCGAGNDKFIFENVAI
jgi:hypothetical protein